MRDGTIHAMHEAEARRVMLLYRQFEFLMTRQEATEAVVMASTLRERIMWLFWPKGFRKAVDAVQQTFLKQSREKLREAAGKPKLTLVGANG